MHTKKFHAKKFKCNFCSFKADVVLKMYEHKLAEHPDIPQEFIPKKTDVKDMILNLLAEQNLDMMEELINLKKYIKGLTLADHL